MHFPATLALLLLLGSLAASHGTHTPAVDSSATWAEQHLASEHHINNYDAGAFFTLHDFDFNGALSREELLRTYGLRSRENPPAPGHRSEDEIWATVAGLTGVNADGEIGHDQWMLWARRGGVLPDFGTGPGHHGDDEWEYEIHHFERFHENDKEDGSDMVMHPEDVEHFKHHEQEEQEAMKAAVLEANPVNEANIPQKFRVQ
ncbi:hypothetical protein FN846DRAFT_782078 [Sphaerosporella brunnea]|uniref:EF-hand domain-containing protein n=1 Tax=Sphaerosporella brunnea TaxID=1250544 RepID=A0A5J5EQV0_9PEZI|nr:hypothetical protein FN846DRAFT_782078 [Sphaerosporella brunnea]